MAKDAGGVTLVERLIGSKAPCPLLRNLDGSYTTLATVLDAMQSDLETVVVCSQVPLDLSGATGTKYVFVADRAYTISAAYAVFTEVSSADAGVNISVGKVIVGTDNAQYFVADVATGASKETGYRQVLTLAQTVIAEGDVITFVSAGSKTGTGEVILELNLVKG